MATVLGNVNKEFVQLLGKYKGGISNTSTAKYDLIKTLLSKEIELPLESVYATGAKDRISNLDTRLAQGNQRNQLTPLGLVFVSQESRQKETREEAVERIRQS